MQWNWQQSDWPNLRWDPARIAASEVKFLMGSGVLLGVTMHLSSDAKTQLATHSLLVEAMTTSEIEGEYLNRESVQSSIQRQFGLKTDARRILPAEQGIAELVVDLYRTVAEPLTPETFYRWHRMVTSGRRDLADIGRLRSSTEPMQIISGASYAPKVHFEAPPSMRVPAEMESFIKWFNDSSPGGSMPLPAITRAGLAHLRFECIHPFEDGNKRIARAIAEKTLVQGMEPTPLIVLASTVLAKTATIL